MIQLTNGLMNGHESGDHSSIRTICEQWEVGLDGLLDKVFLATNLLSLPSQHNVLYVFFEGKI